MQNLRNSWFVADDDGNLAGHDMTYAAAQCLLSNMREEEPDAEMLRAIVVRVFGDVYGKQ